MAHSTFIANQKLSSVWLKKNKDNIQICFRLPTKFQLTILFAILATCLTSELTAQTNLFSTGFDSGVFTLVNDTNPGSDGGGFKPIDLTVLSDNNLVVYYIDEASNNDLFDLTTPSGTKLVSGATAYTFPAGNDPSSVAVTSLANGKFVFTWSEQFSGTSDWDIYYRIMNADGSESTPKTKAFNSSSADRFLATAGLSNGNLLLIYSRSSTSNLYAQRVNGSTGAVIDTTPVVFFTVSTGGEPQPTSATQLSGGDILAVFQEGNTDRDLRVRRIGSDLSSNPVDFVAVTAGSDVGFGDLNVAALSNGGYAFAYADGNDAFIRVYDSNNTLVKNFTWSSFNDISFSRGPVITPLDGGGFVVAINDYNGSTGDLYGQIFDNSGNAVSSRTTLDPSGFDHDDSVQITPTNNGGFIIYIREFDASSSNPDLDVMVRAYQPSAASPKYFISLTTPTLTTTSVSTFDATSATLGGNVTDDGGVAVSNRGVVWNTTGIPDLTDNQVSIGSGTGTFSQSVGLLPFGTQIHVRAYATNSEGTSYGSEQTFTTTSTNAVTASLTGSEGWRLLSVPAAVQLSTFLGPIWTQGVTSGGDTSAGTPNVYRWNLGSPDEDVNDWNAVTDLNITLPAAEGVLVQVYEDPDYDGPTAAGFPQTLNLSGSEYASGTGATMNSTATGWTLLGNPFGSPIDADLLSRTNLAGTIYVWDPNDGGGDAGQPGNQTTGSWKTWNGSSGDVSGGRIAPFQGFFVENTSTGSSITFNQEVKTSTAPPFLGKQQEVPFVRLELQGQGMRNSAWLELAPGVSSDFTGTDAWELTPLSEHYALLATRKPDGSLLDIARYPASGEVQIPLVTEATRPGTYHIEVTGATATGLYLNDLHTRTSMALEPGLRVAFDLNNPAKTVADPLARIRAGLKKSASPGEPRFVISTTPLDIERDTKIPQAFALQQNYPNPFNPVTVIRYQLPARSEVRLEVYDLSGRQVATLVEAVQPAGSYSVRFDGSTLSSGVYMYRLQAGGAVFTKKLTLIK